MSTSNTSSLDQLDPQAAAELREQRKKNHRQFIG